MRGVHSRYVGPDGRVLYLSWTAERRGDTIYAVATNRTSQHEQSSLVRDVAAKLGMVEEVWGVGYWRVDLGEVPSVHWSEQMFRIHGLEPGDDMPTLEEAIGYYHPDDRDLVSSAVDAGVRSGEAFHFRRRIIRVDGAERHVLSRGRVQYDERGAPEAIVGIFQDVTEQTLIQRRLFDEERLDSVSVLAAGLAHEINNPLQYISANLALVRRALEAAEQECAEADRGRLIQSMDDAQHGVSQVARIVGDLKAFMGAEGHEVADVDLGEVLRMATAMTRSGLKHSATFEQRVAPLPTIRADASQLVQVVVNLLINARHAVSELPPKRALVALSAWTTREGDAVIEVEDNGLGDPRGQPEPHL